jgi:hypothetical protein
MRLLRLVVCLVTLVLVGCASTAVGDKAAPPPVALADTSPALLAVTAGVTMGGYTDSTRGTTEIAIQFLSQGRLVSFQKGETLACDGAGPIRLTTEFDQSYPTSAVAGRRFDCTYESGHSSAHIQFVLPRSPALLTPTEGTTVARSVTTIVHFQAEGDIAGIVALGSQDKAIAHVTGPGTATIDTSHFTAGPGQIALTQYPHLTDASAPAFASFQLTCTAMAAVGIIWG